VQNNELEIEEQLDHLLSDVDALRHDLGAPGADQSATEKPKPTETDMPEAKPTTEKPKPKPKEKMPETKPPTEEPLRPMPPKPTEEPDKEKPEKMGIPVAVLMKSMKTKVGDLYFNMFTVMEIMEGMESFRDFKMLKMKMKPSEFLGIFIEDLKRTYFESLKMKVMMKKIVKKMMEKRKEKEEHFHEDQHHGHNQTEIEEKEKEKEKHFDPKKLLGRLQKIWKVLNLACKDKDYLNNMEVLDNLKEMMEGFEKIPMAVKKLQEIRGIVKYIEHKQTQEMINPKIPMKSLVKLSLIKVHKLISIMHNVSVMVQMKKQNEEYMKDMMKEQVKEIVEHKVHEMVNFMGKAMWEKLSEKIREKKIEAIKERVKEMMKMKLKKMLHMKVMFMEKAIAHVADTFWTLKKLRMMFHEKEDHPVELPHTDYDEEHLLLDGIRECQMIQHHLQAVQKFFDEHEFWMDHPGFPWDQIEFDRMKTIFELEKLIHAAPYVFRRMRFVKNIFEMKLEEL